jgi:PAS domain S-box-containing protein
MATAPEQLRVASHGARTYSEWVLDGLTEALLLVDIRPAHKPVLLANAAARQFFRGNHTSFARDPCLYDCLAAAEAGLIEPTLAQLSKREPLGRIVSFRTAAGETSVWTDFKLLDEAGPGLVSLRFAAAPPEPELSFAIDQLPLDLLVLDQNLKITYANAAALRTSGLDRAELLGCSALSVRPTAALPLEGYRRALTGKSHRGELVAVTRSTGVTHWYDIRVQPLQSSGTTRGLLVLASDLTELQGSDRNLHEREILDVVSRERQRIGRDLHDGLGQELTGIALMLRGLARRLERDSPDSLPAVEELLALVNQSIQSTRSLARGLLPVSAEGGGLAIALRELAERGGTLYGMDVRCKTEPWPELRLDETAASHLYRIAQEALTNAARHGHASRVEILLGVTDHHYELQVIDDGEGLPRTPAAAGGLGLRIMNYRARTIGAKLEIGPNEPRGTRVRVIGEQRAAATGV